MKKLLLWVLLAMVAAVIGWGILRKHAPVEVRFARVNRQTLVTTLPTNGKVEPVEWQAVRAEAAGLVKRVDVQAGQRLAQGSEIAALSDPAMQAEIDSAEARVAEAQANLDALQAGGKPGQQTEIDNSVARARLDLQIQQKEYDTLKRLVAKQAATPQELQAAADKLRQTQVDLEGLEKRRGSLVGKLDIEAARARLGDAQAALRLAKQHAAWSVVHAPIAGEIYDLPARPGLYLNVGDLVANVGRLDRLRVRVYVDEPLLGHVAKGQPVSIKWEALPGKRWQGNVEKMPTAIQTLGSRQVGEVVCIIENPGRDLIPGTNIDAEIRTAVVDNALVIPKETLRHDTAGDYVFVLRGDHVERQAVKTGNSTITQVQITEGLAEGDRVAIPGETQLKSGDRAAPVQ